MEFYELIKFDLFHRHLYPFIYLYKNLIFLKDRIINIMESKKRVCSICSEAGHNKRSCPKIPIEDTFEPLNRQPIEE